MRSHMYDVYNPNTQHIHTHLIVSELVIKYFKYEHIRDLYESSYWLLLLLV